jgi:hypothetical protein
LELIASLGPVYKVDNDVERRAARLLKYQCPVCKKEIHYIFVTDGSTFNFDGRPYWHYEYLPGSTNIITISPSINHSGYPCAYHDFYTAKLISNDELDKLCGYNDEADEYTGA